jgi:hypothetical protein
VKTFSANPLIGNGGGSAKSPNPRRRASLLVPRREPTISRFGTVSHTASAGAQTGGTGAGGSHAISSTGLGATRTVSVTGHATDHRTARAYTSTDCCGTITRPVIGTSGADG